MNSVVDDLTWFEAPPERQQEPCLYFPHLTAAAEEAVCAGELAPETVDSLLARGWRHFSYYYFRNNCPHCLACRPLRVAPAAFSPSRSQRRVLRRNQDTGFRILDPREFMQQYAEAAWRIYNRFQQERYGKPPVSLEAYLYSFLISPAPLLASLLLRDGTLIGSGFLDRGARSLSTIYFSFNPDYSRLSPGTFSIMREIQWAREQGLDWYYLGYWINDISAMAYKAAFRPHQLLDFPSMGWKDLPNP